MRVELTDTLAYWTVVDDSWVPVALADAYLRHLRLGADRAEGTTRTYAGDLACYLGWCEASGRDLLSGASALGMFVVMLKTTPVARAGSGQGQVRSPGRINHILAAVRELYKHAVADRALDASVLALLFEVGDDRHLPADLRPEGSGLRYLARPRHVQRSRRASRPFRCGARRPRRWCGRLDPGGTVSFSCCCGSAAFAWGKPSGFAGPTCTWSRRPPPWAVRFPARMFTWWAGTTRTGPGRSPETGQCQCGPRSFPAMTVISPSATPARPPKAATSCSSPSATSRLGQAMSTDTVRKWLAALSARAGLDRAVTPHMFRHATATELLARGASIDVVKELLGHASIRSTEVYLHPDADAQRAAVDRLGPLGFGEATP